MKRLLITLAAAALAGCGSQADDDDRHQSSTPPTTTLATGPSFDCGKAESEAEKLVCSEPRLAALDRQLADEYQHALAEPGTDKAVLESVQRGWVSGRDDCWKADDLRRCVLESYQTRLVELKIDDPDTVRPEAVTYECPDGSKPLTAQFYNQFDPKAAVLTWGTDKAIVFVQPSGSGARYGREGLEFWEHQGEVSVDFYGNEFVCTAP